MKRIGLIALLGVFVLASFSYAQIEEVQVIQTPFLANINAPAHTTFLETVNADKELLANSPLQKASSGTLNAVSAWVDIPKEMNKVSQQDNLFMGMTVGFGKGLIAGLTRGIAGLIDVSTCGFPPYDKPLMKPEYKVKNPEKEGFKITILRW